jgi:hypothetical protein
VEQSHLGLNESFRHHLGVATSSRAIFVHSGNLNELSA